MNTKLSLSFIIFSLFLSCTNSLAEYRVATVDVNKVLNQSSEAKKVKSDLDKKSLAAKKKLESKRKALKTREDKLLKSKISQDSKAAEKFRAEVREFSREVKDTEEDLKRKFMKTNKSLADKSLKIIEKYAKENDIDIVLDKSETARGPVLYGKNTVDITNDIVKLINK